MPKLVCAFCGNRTSNLYFLVHHQKTRHFRCQFGGDRSCRKPFESLEQLLFHVKKTHQDKQLEAIPHACNQRGDLDAPYSRIVGQQNYGNQELAILLNLFKVKKSNQKVLKKMQNSDLKC